MSAGTRVILSVITARAGGAFAQPAYNESKYDYVAPEFTANFGSGNRSGLNDGDRSEGPLGRSTQTNSGQAARGTLKLDYALCSGALRK